MVGHPDNRRARGFVDAGRRLGVPVEVVSWADVEHSLACLERPYPYVLRLESFGEDEEVAVRFRARGFDAARDAGCSTAVRPAEYGEVLAPRQLHAGFLHLLAELERWCADRPWVTLHQPFGLIRTCFDKRATHARLTELGVPVAEAVPVSNRRELLEHYDGRPIWVKLTCGSSASGLGVLRGRTPVFMTTLSPRDGRWYNRLRVQRLHGTAMNDALDFLFREGVHVEREVQRPRLEGAFFDLRLLSICGSPRFVVVRSARHPITNLHLGGWRGSLPALKDAMGAVGRARLTELALRIGAAIPHGHLGVDIAVEPGFDPFRVLELNAFGDLLPRLTIDDLDVYGVEIASLLPNHAGRVLHSW